MMYRAALFLLTAITCGSLPASEPLYENGFDNANEIEPLFQRFKSMAVVDGVLRVEHLQKHPASPTLPIAFTDGVLRFRVKLAGAERFVVRFEDASRVEKAHSHLCRLEINPSVATLRLDQPPKDRDYREPRLFATHRQDFADDQWHVIQIEFSGDTLIATIDGETKLEGAHKQLAHEKDCIYFVVEKGVVLMDDLSLSGSQTKAMDAESVMTVAPDSRGLGLFHDYIEPMFKQHCYECHSHEYEEASGGLVVDSRASMLQGGDLGPSLVPGKPDDSLLLEALLYENDALQMPPEGKLDEQTLAYVRQWIELGAPDPRKSTSEERATPSGPDATKLWSVGPLVEASPPEVADSDWPRSSSDKFILSKLQREGLTPSPDAQPEVLVRRLHFVLTGLPPTIDETDSFVTAAEQDLDQTMKARVDDLLSRRQFGERWGRHWLDVARYSDASGTTAPRPFKEAWRYRDYVVHAFNTDKPWNDFVREQVAGDLIDVDSPVERAEGLIATGFLALSHVVAATRDPETLKMDTIDEQLDVLGKSFLGISIGCARCHDHKLDPFPTRDYYSLAGIFRSTASYGLSGSQESLSLDGAELEVFDDETALWLRGGKGVKIHSVKDAEKARDEPIHLRGEVEMTGDVVPRGFPTLVSAVNAPVVPLQSSGRRQLADWLLDEQNSLPQRVIVNRIWHHVFGQGIVRSTDNFGFTGDPPSHPELLDHLAARFREHHHGSFKSMIRELVLSRTWRQSSHRLQTSTEPTALAAGSSSVDLTPADSAVGSQVTDSLEVDPENRLLWRAIPRRMEAEAIIDSIQFACGRLDPTPADSTVVAFKVGNQGSTSNLEIPDETLKRRAVYWPVFRKDIPLSMDVLGIFDFPPATAPRGRREVTRVPSQSLALLNNPFVIDSARRLQRSLLDDASIADDGERLQVLYKKLYARSPTAEEQRRSIEFLKAFEDDLITTKSAKPAVARSVSWNRLCHTLLVSNEFLVVP